MFKKIISILIVLIAVFAMLYFTGIFDDFFKEDIEPMTNEEVTDEKGMAQLKVSSKIIGESIEVENIKVTGHSPGPNKVLTSINDEGRAVWKDINEVLEDKNANYSNKKFFYLLIVFFSAFLLIYALKSSNKKGEKKSKDNVDFLNNKGK